MNTSLYQLAAQYRALADQLAAADLDAATVADTIEASGIQDDIATKLQSIVFVARELVTHHGVIDAEIDRLKALKAKRTKAADGLLSYAKNSIEAIGLKRVEAPMMLLSVQNNPPSVQITNADTVPLKFLRLPEVKPPEPVPDKKLLLAALKAGEDVPGVALSQSTRLVVS